MKYDCLKIEDWVCGSQTDRYGCVWVRWTWVCMGLVDMGIWKSDGHTGKVGANVPSLLINNSDSAQSAESKLRKLIHVDI